MNTDDQKIIWIASYPKSGNTWVRVFLHNLLHGLQSDAQSAYDINRLSKHTVWDIDIEPYRQLLGKTPTADDNRAVAAQRPEVQRLHAAVRSRPFFMKTHHCVATYEDHPTINFNATLAGVYVIRNPLDVAISYAHHSVLDLDHVIKFMGDPHHKTKTNDQYVYEFMGSWSSHVASWMSVWSRPIYIMRYEDMLAEPVKTFGALAEFLRLKPQQDQLETAIKNSSFEEVRQQESDHTFNERPEAAERFFREGRAGQWRDVMTAEQIRAVLEYHAPMMQRCGYLPPNAGKDILASKVLS